MNDERNAMTLIFPQIRELCARRGVEFVPVDLRWGITESSAKEGRVLETCLREIDRSRPFFIGIIGQRYGWSPTEADLGFTGESLKRQYPRLADWLSKGLSITEMEILYGALSHVADTDGKVNAAFFIRSDKATIPPHYREAGGSEAERKLKELKKRIRSQHEFEVCDYNTPEELGQMVLSALTDFLKKEFPEEPVKSYDRMAARQEMLLESRSKSLFDLSRHDGELMPRIANTANKWLSITGLKGSGKSYLLAHIVQQLRKSADSPAVIYFDCSSDREGLNMAFFVLSDILNATDAKSRQRSQRDIFANSLKSFLLNICRMPIVVLRAFLTKASGNREKASEDISKAMIKTFDDIQSGPLKSLYNQLIKSLKNGSGRPVFVVLDNLDALEEHIAVSAVNIFNTIPAVRFIVTTASRAPIQSHLLNILKASYISIGNLSAGQAREYIDNYLSQYGKQLDEGGRQRELLVNSRAGGTPLLLSYTLGLMVAFGSFDELDRYIADLAAVRTEREIYEVMIRNIAGQFAGNGYADTALTALGALAASPAGLTEEEFFEIFRPSPMAWATVRPYVVNMCGRRAHELFLPTDNHFEAINATAPDYVRGARLRVAEYFENMDCDSGNMAKDAQNIVRRARILMPLYHAAGMNDELYLWATFIGGDISLTDKQRSEYWQTLFKAGYNMRSAPDPDLTPAEKRKGSIIVSGSKSPKKDFADMYTRWAVVAAANFRSEDSLWLSWQTSAVVPDNESTVFSRAVDAQKLYSEKDYAALVALDGRPSAGNCGDILSDFHIGLAYNDMQEFDKAYTTLTRAYKTARKLNVESFFDFALLICAYANIACQLQRFENIDSLLSILESHLDAILPKGLNSPMLSAIARSLAKIYLAKGLYDKSLRAATLWQKSAAATRAPVDEANMFIAYLTSLRRQEPL